MERFNLLAASPEYDDADPEGYRAGMDRFGPKIGASQIGGSVYEIPPGQSICPYHYEYPEEEWLIPLDGVVIVRTPEGEAELGSFEVVAFPPGAAGGCPCRAVAAATPSRPARSQPSCAAYASTTSCGSSTCWW